MTFKIETTRKKKPELEKSAEMKKRFDKIVFVKRSEGKCPAFFFFFGIVREGGDQQKEIYDEKVKFVKKKFFYLLPRISSNFSQIQFAFDFLPKPVFLLKVCLR